MLTLNMSEGNLIKILALEVKNQIILSSELMKLKMKASVL